ncbi:MAG: iron export ABC transporter permease subunit FetB [Gammaproteobacteria bacterium]|nr:iron export ABC transporter permease subunit FetB [Gammaproteobacteria bacterium]
MSFIHLSTADLAIAAALVALLALLGPVRAAGLSRQLVVAGVRTAVQLTIIGYVLKALFGNVSLLLVALLAAVMLGVSGYEVRARQQRGLRGWWGYGSGAIAMFISSFSVTVFALVVLVGAQPWYTPQYAIPLLGMLLGNTMNGVALGLDRLTQSAWEHRNAIEARLMLGEPWEVAIAHYQRQALRSGLIPIINAMAAAGVVSLPGMMTGQIMAGAPPVEAVKYQVLIMFLIAGGSGLGTLAAIWLASRRLFDHRHRLRLERLRGGR